MRKATDRRRKIEKQMRGEAEAENEYIVLLSRKCLYAVQCMP